MSGFSTISGDYKLPLTVSVVLQVILLLLNVRLFLVMPPRVFFAALLLYWTAVSVLILFRPRSPEPLSLCFVAFGFPLLYIAALYLEPLLLGKDGQ